MITARILKNNGLDKISVIGCPVWYDENFLNKEIKEKRKIKKVVISDPGLTKKAEEHEVRAIQAIHVVRWIQKKFAGADFLFTFNNGVDTKYSKACNSQIKDYLVQAGIRWEDLSGNADGFRLYDDADLHIGFRVHSHIKCLSRNIPSVLIEEDIRGFGVNDILRIPHVYSYDLRSVIDGKYQPNKYLLSRLNDVVDELCEGMDLFVLSTRKIIDYYYNFRVCQWMNGIKKQIETECS